MERKVKKARKRERSADESLASHRAETLHRQQSIAGLNLQANVKTISSPPGVWLAF
jgi:hypothetical protein